MLDLALDVLEAIVEAKKWHEDVAVIVDGGDFRVKFLKECEAEDKILVWVKKKNGKIVYVAPDIEQELKRELKQELTVECANILNALNKL